MKKENKESYLQPILFTKDQYKELLRAISAYALIKQSATLPHIDATKLGDYLIEQGEKFGFEKLNMNELDWFDEINDEVFEALFDYTQEEMWQHLANLLARRDVKNEIEDKTGLSPQELPPDTFLDAMGKKVEIYLKEFENNGLNNVSVNCKGINKTGLKIKEI
jgi:hypothetical protein